MISTSSHSASRPGMTLIELVIVVALIGILLTLAVPTYRQYVQRVHRTEAVRLLLQTSMCQERTHASEGRYDSTRCQPQSGNVHYQITFTEVDTDSYTVMATPRDKLRNDPCGSLWMDQSGKRGISANGTNSTKCWSGR